LQLAAIIEKLQETWKATENFNLQLSTEKSF